MAVSEGQSFATARVAATFAGTVIGAGFASGQEISQFFVCYGWVGLWGIVMAAGLFAWLGGALLELGARRQATVYYEAIYQLCGRRLGFFLDLATTAFLFTALAVMLAGAATVAEEYFGLPYFAGLAAAGLAAMLTVLGGLRGIVAVNMMITPLLALGIILISAYSFSYHGLSATLPGPQDAAIPAPHWALASLLYVSYNLVISSTVLIPLGRSINRRRTRLLGGAAGGLILGLLALPVATVTLIHSPEALRQEVPILYVACSQSLASGILYALTLLVAIYTTAIAALYGCLEKVRSFSRLPAAVNVLIILLLALICGQIGFANLIKLLFPLFGYATLLFIIRLAWFSLRGN
jgi:uncharacterized membrane protein YkvI